MIRVYIIAPVIATRAGLRSLLGEDLRIQVVGESASIEDASFEWAEAEVVLWAPAASLAQDRVLTGLEKLAPNGSSALLLMHDDPGVVDGLVRSRLQVWGILSPEASQGELTAAIEALSEGLLVINPVWVKQLSSNPRVSLDDDEQIIEPLTGRETEILQLIALGLTNKQIASRLGISAHTVKFHVSAIFGKLGATNRAETVKLGLKKGLILL